MKTLDIGIIGLSVMGHSLALNMADHGFSVGGYNRSAQVTKDFVSSHPHPNFTPYFELKELVEDLSRPRKVFLMVKAGGAVDAVIEQLAALLDPGDIIMDGGNSFYEDTARRATALLEQGISYFGVGVSGGETGARNGPSIMPGGDRTAYGHIQPILESIAAKATDGAPCCAYIGPGGAGHYVKMVHNGIEYADMQLIAEAYLLLKYVGGLDNRTLSDVFRRWNSGELHSYLIGITADILAEPEGNQPGALVDYIEDSAQQKGTGRWTSIEALRQGVDISLITAACNARILSNRLDERAEAARRLHGPDPVDSGSREDYIEAVRQGLYTAKIAAYAQGFALLRDASETFHWDLKLGEIAAIFRAGCIIQAAFLDDITRAFQCRPDLTNLMLDREFCAQVGKGQAHLRRAAITGHASGLPIPALSSALSYLDAFRSAHVGANLIQAQRDYFGAHTFRRTDQPGVFHHEWGRSNG